MAKKKSNKGGHPDLKRKNGPAKGSGAGPGTGKGPKSVQRC